MRLPLPQLLVAGALTAAVVGGGVAVAGGANHDDRPPPPREKPFSTTALADVDTTTARVARAPFCSAIDDRQVDAALGAAPDPVQWVNGDRLDLGGTGAGSTDVVHEFGCSYAAPDGGTARAWVFAPPVAAAQAQQLVRSAAKAPGCQVGSGPAFGSPTLALTCTEDGTTRVSYRGLFGDAWLVCEVELPAGSAAAVDPVDPVDPVDTAGRWCVGVLQAVGTAAAG
jgi:hypothetical protein